MVYSLFELHVGDTLYIPTYRKRGGWSVTPYTITEITNSEFMRASKDGGRGEGFWLVDWGKEWFLDEGECKKVVDLRNEILSTREKVL